MSVRAKDILKAVLKAHSDSTPNKSIVLTDQDLNEYSSMIEKIGDLRKVKKVTFVDGENYLNNGGKTFVDLFTRFPERNVVVFVKWTLNNRDPRRVNDITEFQRKALVDVCANNAGFCDNEIDDIVLLTCALYETKRFNRAVTVMSNDKYKFLGSNPELKINRQDYDPDQLPASKSPVSQGPVPAAQVQVVNKKSVQTPNVQSGDLVSRETAGMALILATPVFAMVLVVAALFSN